jgi:hypothetical protein
LSVGDGNTWCTEPMFKVTQLTRIDPTGHQR